MKHIAWYGVKHGVNGGKAVISVPLNKAVRFGSRERNVLIGPNPMEQ